MLIQFFLGIFITQPEVLFLPPERKFLLMRLEVIDSISFASKLHCCIQQKRTRYNEKR